MSIITTSGGSTSNSYVTQAEADSYFSSTYFNSTWSALSSSDKDNWLIESTRAIDRFHYRGFRWKGKDQALSFPRISSRNRISGIHSLVTHYMDFDFDDAETPTGTIPEDVKKAQYLMIMYLKNNQSTTDGTIESKEIKSVKAANGLAEVEYLPENRQENIKIASGGSLEAIESLLRPWLHSQNSIPLR
jgi:hypothetical protein